MLTSLKNLIRVWTYLALHRLDPDRYPKPDSLKFHRLFAEDWNELEEEMKGVFGEKWGELEDPMGLRKNIEFWRLVSHWKVRNPIIHENIMREYRRFNACVADPSLDPDYYKKYGSVATITYNGEVRVERVDSAQHMLVWMESQGI